MDDVRVIADLAGAVGKMGRRIRNRPPRLRVTVSSFVPKAHTPCQWSAQDTEGKLQEKHSLLQQNLQRGATQLSWHDTRISLLEAALSRGDRRLGQVIYAAWHRGCRLDTWSEFFDFSKWQQSFAECGLDASFYANRERDPSEHLPWQHISSGVSAGFLLAERERMSGGATTPDCRTGSCNLCGLQSKHPACRDRAQSLHDKGSI
jgi:hypothetical protein